MVHKWILLILVITNICSGSNNGLNKQKRSVSATKIPRFNSVTGNFEGHDSPENFFPNVEYPSDILDVATLYYFRAGEDAVLEPFPRDVKNSFKSITHAKAPMKQPMAVHKPAHSSLGLKLNGINIIKTLSPKTNTLIDKKNASNEILEAKTNYSEPENLGLDTNSTENFSQESFTDEVGSDDVLPKSQESAEFYNSTETYSQESFTEENLTVSTENHTTCPMKVDEQIENNNACNTIVEKIDTDETLNSTEIFPALHSDEENEELEDKDEIVTITSEECIG